MELTGLPKPSKIPIVIATSSLLLCLFTNASAQNVKSTTSKSSPAILQNIKAFCKQNSSKKDQWNEVCFIPYLQQTNTQINSDSPAIAINESIPPSHNNPLNDVAADTLLEELLGVHTFTKPAHRQQPIWSHLSFDFSIGAGAVFYSNRLEQMYLVQREQDHDYFFVTKTNEVYKPNWFHDTLNKVSGFNQLNDNIKQGSAQNAAFQGKGFGLPITLAIQYVFWQHLLLGVGKEMVFNATNRLVHNENDIAYKEYIMDKKWSAQGRWFAKCGWYTSSSAKHRFFADMRLFFVYHLGNMFTLATLATHSPYLDRALAYNFGLGYEQQLTDHLSYTTRLSMEQQQFKQFSNKESYDYNIQYRQPAIYLQLGLSIRLAKYHPAKKKNKEYQYKNNSNGTNKTEGLEDLLGLD